MSSGTKKAGGLTVVVIGGGIAGISCIEALFLGHNNDQRGEGNIDRVILISEDKLIKRVTNYRVSGRQLETFDVVGDAKVEELNAICPNGLQFLSLVGSVEQVDSHEKTIRYTDYTSHAIDGSQTSKTLPFDILCVCIGAKPKTIQLPNKQKELSERVLVIRDTSSLEDLKQKISGCRRLAIVGNGGISLELVAKVSGCHKVWLIRDDYIGMTYLDPAAAKFLLDSVAQKGSHLEPGARESRITHQSVGSKTSSTYGPSVGPSWSQGVNLTGACSFVDNLEIIYNDEVKEVHYSSHDEYPIEIETICGKRISCDLIVSGIGVEPNYLEFIGRNVERSPTDGGILIDEQMRTSVASIYAAGDAVSCDNWPKNDLWFQMRLWTQARQMGYFAGRCISSHITKQDPSIYFSFDCFTHCTNFFSHKLVLLGRYNCQSVDNEVIARVNQGKDYVKVLLKDGRVVGAVLVGESGLEETMENLIHDRIDVSIYKDQLLDDTVDIEDYFD